jgi:hypothetical protein
VSKNRVISVVAIHNTSSINHRITSLTPNPLMVIHHQMNNDGSNLPYDFGALGHLAAVDGTVPGGPELISQCVQASNMMPITLLVSLWSVDDDVTRQLMVRFL